MNTKFYNALSGMTDRDTAIILLNVLPTRTRDIANALIERGTITGFIRDYAFFQIKPDEFVTIMDSINERMNLI